MDLVNLDLLDLLVQVDLRAVLDQQGHLGLLGHQGILVLWDNLGHLDHRDHQDPPVGQGSLAPQAQQGVLDPLDQQDFKADLVRN